MNSVEIFYNNDFELVKSAIDNGNKVLCDSNICNKPERLRGPVLYYMNRGEWYMAEIMRANFYARKTNKNVKWELI